MATRMYLGRESFSAIDPGTLGSWGFNYRQRYKMETTKQNTSFSTYTITGMTGTSSTLMRQFITRPMNSGVTLTGADQWSFSCRYSESNTATNIMPKIYCSVVSQTGIPRGYSFILIGGVEFSTSLASRYLVTTGLLGSYAIQSGDRLVLEVGWDKTASGTSNASISLGDLSASSDLSGSDGDTGNDVPWFEYSGTLSFQAEGTAPTEGDNYQLTSYISAVLDEWV